MKVGANSEWLIRLSRSRQALEAWKREARLPWANREMAIAIATTEIAVLQDLVGQMPGNTGSETEALRHDWEELRQMLIKK